MYIGMEGTLALEGNSWFLERGCSNQHCFMLCPCVCEHVNYPLLNARQCHQESELALFYMQRNHPVRVSRDSFFDSRYVFSTIHQTVRSLFANHKCYLWLTQVKIRNLLEDVWSSLLKGEEPVGLYHRDIIRGPSLLAAVVKMDPLQPFSILELWGQNSDSRNKSLTGQAGVMCSY